MEVEKGHWNGADEHLWDKLGGREWLSIIFGIPPDDFRNYVSKRNNGVIYNGVFSYYNVNINTKQLVVISIIEEYGLVFLITNSSPEIKNNNDYFSLPRSSGIGDIPSAEIVKQLSEATGYHLF